MYRKACKLFLIIALALMMVSGSFLVSMAKSSSPDAQSSRQENVNDLQSKSGNQEKSSEKNKNDNTADEEITSDDGADNAEPTVNENDNNREDDNNINEEDASGGEKAKNERSSKGNRNISSPDPDSNIGSDDAILIDISSKNSYAESQIELIAQTINNNQSAGSELSDLNDEAVKTDTSDEEDGLNGAIQDSEPKKGIDIINAPDEYANQLEAFHAPWTGHTKSELKFVSEEFVAPTCGTSGYYKKIVHCHACGNDLEQYKIFEPTGNHTHGAPVEDNRTEPSCEKPGSFDEVVYCSVCHIELSRENKEIPSLDHDMGEWEVIKDATPFEDGLVERHCLREGCSHTESETLRLLIGEPKPFEEEKGLSYIYEEPPAPVNPAMAILGEFSAPASESSSGSSSESSGSSRRSGSDIYTASVSPSLPIAIESEDTADTSIIEDTPIPDNIPPVTDFESEDFSGVSGLTAYLVLAIDILLSVGLIVGLGVLWKLGILRK